MKIQIKQILVAFALGILLTACNGGANIDEATIIPTEVEATEVIPTNTPQPLPTDIPVEPTETTVVVQNTATPFPGDMIYPIDAMDDSIPIVDDHLKNEIQGSARQLGLKKWPYRSRWKN